MSETDDKRIPTLDFYLSPPFEDDGKYRYMGNLYFNNKKICKVLNFEKDTDVFKEKRKPKGRERMIAYTLAYHLALLKNGSFSKNAAKDAANWLGIENEQNIIHAKRKYPIPKNAVIMACEKPLGIIAMIEQGKIIREQASALSQLNFRVKRFEFRAGLVHFHLPIDASLLAVDRV